MDRLCACLALCHLILGTMELPPDSEPVLDTQVLSPRAPQHVVYLSDC